MYTAEDGGRTELAGSASDRCDPLQPPGGGASPKGGCSSLAYCPLVDCEKLSRLRAAIQEAIEVLDETRSSFKSKRLEVMRKKLIDILAGC